MNSQSAQQPINQNPQCLVMLTDNQILAFADNFRLHTAGLWPMHILDFCGKTTGIFNSISYNLLPVHMCMFLEKGRFCDGKYVHFQPCP